MKVSIKKNAMQFVKTVQEVGMKMCKFGSKYAPSICTGVGLVGMGGTMLMVHKSSPKYHEAVNNDEMPALEKAKIAIKTYWPSLLSFGASSACIIAGNRISSKRYLALASAASLAQKELLNTQESIIESLGSDALKDVKKKVAEKRNKDLELTEEEISNTGNGNELYYEPLTNHYFRSSENDINRVVNELNSWLVCNDEVCFDTLLTDWGVKSCEIAKSLFFSTSHGGYNNGSISIDFIPSYVKIDGKNELCWEIVYNNPPRGEYPFPW